MRPLVFEKVGRRIDRWLIKVFTEGDPIPPAYQPPAPEPNPYDEQFLFGMPDLTVRGPAPEQREIGQHKDRMSGTPPYRFPPPDDDRPIEERRARRVQQLSEHGHWGPDGLVLLGWEDVQKHMWVHHGCWWGRSTASEIKEGHRLLHEWAARAIDTDHAADDFDYGCTPPEPEPPKKHWWQRAPKEPTPAVDLPWVVDVAGEDGIPVRAILNPPETDART